MGRAYKGLNFRLVSIISSSIILRNQVINEIQKYTQTCVKQTPRGKPRSSYSRQVLA